VELRQLLRAPGEALDVRHERLHRLYRHRRRRRRYRWGFALAPLLLASLGFGGLVRLSFAMRLFAWAPLVGFCLGEATRMLLWARDVAQRCLVLGILHLTNLDRPSIQVESSFP
jgi:hypothetical protein